MTAYPQICTHNAKPARERLLLARSKLESPSAPNRPGKSRESAKAFRRHYDPLKRARNKRRRQAIRRARAT